MFILSYSALILSIICFCFAALIHRTKNKNHLTNYFVAYIIFIGLWIGSNALADFAQTDFTVRLWSGFCLITGSAYISFYLLFIDAFITESYPRTIKKIIFFAPTLFFSLFAFTRWYTVETYITPGVPAQILPGPLYYPVLIYTLGGLIFGIYLLLRSYITASFKKKKQIFYLTLGFSLVLLGAIIFTVILPLLLAEYRFYTLGPQLALVTIVTTAYAIYKHQLLNIKIVLQRSLIYTLLFFILLVLFLVTLFSMINIFNSQAQLPFFLSALLTGTIGALGGPYLEKKFRSLTDAFFFKEKYNFSEVIQKLSHQLSVHNTITELIIHTGTLLESSLRAKQVVFALTPPHAVPTERGACLVAPTNNTTEEFPLLAALKTADTTLGLILIGQKRSGEEYTVEDTQLVETFACQAAIAFNKALLYQEVLDYSENLNQKVQERTAEIAHIQTNQTKMILDISHHLQTPLTVIRGEFDRAKTNLPNTTPLKNLEQSITRIASFTQAMLALATLENTHDTKKQQFNFSELVCEVVEYVTTLAEEQQATVRAHITPHLLIWGNREQLEQLITNLLSNSLKYLANERKITITLELQTKIILTISDTGIGIPEDKISKLFQRFYRIETNSSQPGSGLGLAICKQIVENHNGTILVQSQVGQGTSFIVSLPSS